MKKELLMLSLLMFLVVISGCVKQEKIEEGKLTKISQPFNVSQIDIYGDKIVFINKGLRYPSEHTNSDIFLYDITSGKTIQITSEISRQHKPKIHGNKIIWLDSRFVANQGSDNFYMYDLSVGKEEKLFQVGYFPGEYYFYNDNLFWLDLQGDGYWYVYNLKTKEKNRLPLNSVYWDVQGFYEYKIVGRYQKYQNDTFVQEIFVYDLSKNSTKFISIPTASGLSINEDKIVWTDSRNSPWHPEIILNPDIYMYDLSTEQETQITKQDTREFAKDIYGNIIVYNKNTLNVTGYIENDQLMIHDLSTGEDKVIISSRTWYENIYGNKIVWVSYEDEKLTLHIYTI